MALLALPERMDRPESSVNQGQRGLSVLLVRPVLPAPKGPQDLKALSEQPVALVP